MIDPTLIKSCNLQELPVIGDKIEEKEQNTVRFYFENLNGICSGLWGIDKGFFYSSYGEIGNRLWHGPLQELF